MKHEIHLLITALTADDVTSNRSRGRTNSCQDRSQHSDTQYRFITQLEITNSANLSASFIFVMRINHHFNFFKTFRPLKSTIRRNRSEREMRGFSQKLSGAVASMYLEIKQRLRTQWRQNGRVETLRNRVVFTAAFVLKRKEMRLLWTRECRTFTFKLFWFAPEERMVIMLSLELTENKLANGSIRK